ncbi:uncharacterized protein LOC123659305 [Melitaea cinxia]|uniref:uncharacterized protein LOC123659305 n=1 Tax=Melitaea cinxia TaxID=113334 RepID=UPI001E274521|nr:uncharacterized protein LOC123659305 [Melitaea cinxia]
MATRNINSMDTILTYDNRDAQSQWSVVWSTAHIPGMDNASGGAQRGMRGRRKLRLGSLALGACLTMHCRVAASALTGGFFLFMLFLIMSTGLLANPLRHFEVYLGQWSISGPGRAFRILPMFEGIGLAICINALVRAIICCTIASIAAIYVFHSVSDSKLPFTHCRDFDLKPYNPVAKNVTFIMLSESNLSSVTGELSDENMKPEHVTVGTQDLAWRNVTDKNLKYEGPLKNITRRTFPQTIEVCNEGYSMGYPTLFSTPAYNFFYIEVVLFREDNDKVQFNMALSLCLTFVWSILWVLLIKERLSQGRLIWNNVHSWLVVVPWIWSVVLLVTAIIKLFSLPEVMRKVFRIGAKEVIAGLADALEISIYIHSASVGSEIIHGKGLNHYAMGHIDPHLNGENVWHSGLLLLLTGLHSAGAAICALVDCIQPNTKTVYNMKESTLWIIPMYSKCALINNYSHFLSTLIFSGLSFSYMSVAYILVKTALHTIFECKVKLVFKEQAVVAGTILTCMGLSLLFATNSGVVLLESVDAIMTGIAMPSICLLELVALLYIYRNHDFISDMNIATEENACSTRIGAQWQIIPFIVLATVVMRVSLLCGAELPRRSLWAACAPLAAALLAPVLRAAHNAYAFLRPARRTA